MIKRLIWTIWTPMSSVLKKADKLNLSLSLSLKLPSGKYQDASLMISQYLFSWWLCAVRQPANIWANVDQDWCRHAVSPGHNEWILKFSLSCSEFFTHYLIHWLYNLTCSGIYLTGPVHFPLPVGDWTPITFKHSKHIYLQIHNLAVYVFF